MTAALLLDLLRQDDIHLTVSGCSLAFDAPAGAMTPDLLATIKARKPELLAVLAGGYRDAALALVATVGDPDRRADLIEWFEERAGIREYDGNTSRADAERQAYFDLSHSI